MKVEELIKCARELAEDERYDMLSVVRAALWELCDALEKAQAENARLRKALEVIEKTPPHTVTEKLMQYTAWKALSGEGGEG